MRNTTQRAARVDVDNITIRLKTRQDQIEIYIIHERKWGYTFFYETVYLQGDNFSKMFCSQPWFIYTYHMKTNAEYGYALSNFINIWKIKQFLRKDQAK